MLSPSTDELFRLIESRQILTQLTVVFFKEHVTMFTHEVFDYTLADREPSRPAPPTCINVRKRLSVLSINSPKMCHVRK